MGRGEEFTLISALDRLLAWPRAEGNGGRRGGETAFGWCGGTGKHSLYFIVARLEISRIPPFCCRSIFCIFLLFSCLRNFDTFSSLLLLRGMLLRQSASPS